MVLVVISLATGGAAQWGWNTLNSAGEANALVVSRDNAADNRPDATRNSTDATVTPNPVASPTATSSTKVTTPPSQRVSRDGERTTEPSSTPARPVPKPTRSKAATAAAPSKSLVPDRRAALEAEAVELTNAERAKNGCDPLRTDAKLRTAARGHSDDMRKRGYFDHNTPDGEDPWERAEAAGYDQPTGENIARGQQSAKDVVEAWMDSPGHRANILNCDSEAIGVGVALGGDGPYWTQMFGAV